MFAKTTIAIALITLTANAECIGEKFFKGSSKRFLPGLENVCFGMTPEKISSKIEPEVLVKDINRFKGYENILPQTSWYDRKGFSNWFNDGGSCCFGNIYYKNWTSTTSYEDMGDMTSEDFGISSVYVGSKDKKETSIAFTFYDGKSEKYVRKVDRKYEKYETVRGLFNITLNVDSYLSAYFTSLLDTTGYIRRCNDKTTTNCTVSSDPDRIIVLTDDSSVAVIFDKAGRKVHIRLRSDLYSLASAMQQNAKYRYENFLMKYSKLDE